MKATYRIEKLDDAPITNSGFFVAVYKNDECIGTCLAGPDSTPYECAKSVYANRDIDKMERQHYEDIDRMLDY